MSLNDYLNSLPENVRAQARQDLEALPEPAGRLDELFEQAAYEASVALDPTGARISRVVLRLFGDETVDASLDNATAEHVLGAFDREVKAAAGEGHADAKLRLVGFSAGSVVLHFEPVRPEIVDDEAGAIPVWSVADHAIETVLDLHKAIESQRPAAEIQNRFKEPGLLKAAKHFLDVLDHDNLDSSARWYGPTGNISVATVTNVGRTYALGTLFAAAEESETEVVSGMVVALDIDGSVTIKSGKRKPVIRAPKEMVAAGEFTLGGYLHVRAKKTYDSDRVGLTSKPTYDFIEFAFAFDEEPEPLI